MKCIKSKDGEIRRVSDVDADNKVKVHGWKFVPKSEWKTNVRGVFKSTNVNPPKEKKEKVVGEYKEKKSKK